MFKLKFSDVEILHMNKASMTINIKSNCNTCLITRKNFNKLLRNKELECMIIVKEDLNGHPLNWIATLSIF